MSNLKISKTKIDTILPNESDSVSIIQETDSLSNMITLRTEELYTSFSSLNAQKSKSFMSSIDISTLSENDFYYVQDVEIYLNNVIIGRMNLCPSCYCLGLELIHIEEPYRGNGYGTIAIKKLIDICTKLNMEFIHGDSPNARKPFYTRLGAKYECRDEYDESFINDRFYIDLI